MAAEKVVMGWLQATDPLPFFVALEEKAFENAGMEIVSQKFTSPRVLVDAFLSDQVEVGPYGIAPGITLAAEAQTPGSLKLFGFSGGVTDTDDVNSSLLVKTAPSKVSIRRRPHGKLRHIRSLQFAAAS